MKASGDMRTADALVALGDLRGLRAQLSRMNWDQQDHLRLALIAYVAHSRQDEDEARSYWRTALGAAAGDPDRLRQLGALATHWNWQPEKMEALARVFGADPNDLATRNELMRYYRSTGQTSNLVAVLNAYLSAHPDDQAERCGFAYYSMLSGLNISQAYVIAKEAYDAEPGATLPRLVYAFALWKQRRPQEAWDLLEDVADHGPAVVPAPLLRAAVLADLNRRADAERSLGDFDATRALPEEATLATMLESRLKEFPRVSRL